MSSKVDELLEHSLIMPNLDVWVEKHKVIFDRGFVTYRDLPAFIRKLQEVKDLHDEALEEERNGS